jgi:glutaredoxin
MDDQNNQSNPTSQSVNDQKVNLNNVPVSPNVPVVNDSPVVAQDPSVNQQPNTTQPPMPQNEDLQKISNDLENLAKEAESSVASTPQSTNPVPVVVTPNPVQEPQDAQSKNTADQVEVKPETKGVDITVYTTASCPFCKTEKDFLNAEGLVFTEKNVEEDNEALKEMLTLSDNFAGVPVTSVEGPKGKKVIKGFTKNEFITELQSVGIEVKTPLSEEAAATAKSEKPTTTEKPEAVQNVVQNPAPISPSVEPATPQAQAPSQPEAPVAEQTQPVAPTVDQIQPETSALATDEPTVPDLN